MEELTVYRYVTAYLSAKFDPPDDIKLDHEIEMADQMFKNEAIPSAARIYNKTEDKVQASYNKVGAIYNKS